MVMADDGLQYIQSVVVGLIVSFLLAKLFSVVFSSGDENRSLTGTNPNQHQSEVLPSDTRRKSAEKEKQSDAEFSKNPSIDHQTKIVATGSDSDDDWEGVETTELDEAFCAATTFAAAIAADRSEQKVSNKIRLELYGLYKIATDGACSVPQPSAIKITARAKWNAWNKLGDMSPEEAMQKYLEIITKLFPTWSDGSTSKRIGGDKNETSFKDNKPMGTDISSYMHDEESGNEFKLDTTHEPREDDADNLLKITDDQMHSHWAVDRDHIDVAEMVLKKNADINHEKNDEIQTTIQYADDCEQDDTGKNAARCIQDDDDDGKYPSDLCNSNWHSI